MLVQFREFLSTQVIFFKPQTDVRLFYDLVGGLVQEEVERDS